MNSERKRKMIAMRKRLQNEFASIVNPLQMNPDLKTPLLFLLKARVDQFGIRSFFVHTVSEYVKEQAKTEGLSLKVNPDKLFNTQLPFLAEGVITVQYYENQILDGKGGLYTDQGYDMDKVQRNVTAGHYVKDLLYRYIDEVIFPNDGDNYRLTMRKVTKIFQLVDLGQEVQDKWGTYEAFRNIDKPISISKEADDIINKDIIIRNWEAVASKGLNSTAESFTYNYLQRIYLTSGALFQLMAELVMDTLGYQGKQRENILKFSAQLGITGQIVNDINDFVPAEHNICTMSKIPNDALADIRNNNVTLPLIFYFDNNPKSSMQSLQQMKNPLKLLPAIGEAINQAKSVAQKTAEISQELINVPQRLMNKEGDPGVLLLDMNNIVYEDENRFYQAINKYLTKKPVEVPPTIPWSIIGERWMQTRMLSHELTTMTF